jgi:hypothetical protein
MLIWGGAAYQDVIQVAESKIQSAQDLVHESLERPAGAPQTKRHAKKLPESEGGDNRRFVNVALLYWDLVVAFTKIQLAEDSATAQPRREVLNVGQRVGIRCGSQVQAAIIAAGPP